MSEKGIEVSLTPEIIGHIAGLPITNSLILTTVVCLLLMLLFIIGAKKLKQIPGTLQLFLETYLSFVYSFVNSITNNPKMTKKMYPLFATMGIFFLFSNLIGLIPGLTSITFNGTQLLRTPTTDYSLVFAITMTMFIIMQGIAIVTGGLFGYIGKFFNFSSPLNFVLGLLDIIGETAKIVSLSFRLFGNIFAGEVIGTVLLTLAPYFAPIPFALLGLLGSVIQAFVFPILVIIFMNMSIIVKEEREKEVGDEAMRGKNAVLSTN